jgi:uncharacterized small protein (DUF1192 family)
MKQDNVTQQIQVQNSDTYQTQDDVVINVVTTTPQPDAVSTQIFTVGSLNKTIADLDASIAQLQAERDKCQSYLDSTSQAVSNVQLTSKTI